MCIRDSTEAVIRGLEKKHFKNAKETIEQVIALNDKRRSTQNQLDKNLAEVNSLSRTIGQLMKEGKKEEAETARARVAELKEGNKELDATMTQAATDMQNALYTIPNIPYDSVPEGVGAEDNVVEKMGGMETELPKDALPHWELAKKYDLIDFDLGVKITGAGFPVYKGKGAQLQRALINFFLDEARKSGYIEIMPPTVVNAASGYGTGQLPDKEGQMYHCEVDDLYLIPTAEVPVTNIYRDVILDEKQLPIKNCAYTQCFRREAGSYGKDVRGLNRLHEFSKVELVRIDKPEHSKQSHQEMLDHVEGLLQKLELPYRILRLCGGDMSFTAALCFDFEVYSVSYTHLAAHPVPEREFPKLNSLIIGVDIERELRREKITLRLKQRLDEGMVDEVRQLIREGISPEDLIYYGLEYKYLTLYVTGQMTYEEMFNGLETAIHQFAKRQMTWFRGMERRGFTIHWISAKLPMEEKIAFVKEKLQGN